MRRSTWLAATLSVILCVPWGLADELPIEPPPSTNAAAQPHAPLPATIPLHVVNLPSGVRYPIASGVPFPRGALQDVTTLRLLENTQPIVAQFAPLARWPDGSLKSVLVTAFVEAGPSYALSTGQSPSLAAPAVEAPALPGDLVLVVDGTDYRVSRDKHQTATIEFSGPVCTVKKLTGTLTAANGHTSLDYLIRLFAFAGAPLLAMDVTVIDTRPEDVNAPKPFVATAYELNIPCASTGYAIGGERQQVYSGPLQQEEVFLYQRGDSLFRDGWPNGFTMDYTGVGAGTQAPGWLLATSASSSLGVVVKDFWQQFPKALAINTTTVRVQLHPERASAEPKTPGNSHPRPRTFYFPREGGAKTYQLLIARGVDAPRLQLLHQAFQAGPRLAAPPAWYAASGVFGRLLPAGPETQGYDEYLLAGYYDASFAPALANGGVAVTYGWRDFGDRLRGGNEGPTFYNDTHVGSHLYFIQYLRTQDERWWWIAEKASRQWMDLDVSHTHRHGHWNADFGPGEGHMINHDIHDHVCRNIHSGHAMLSGLPDYYLLTGDRRAYDVLREASDWWVNAVNNFFPLPVPNPHGAEAERDYAWPLFVLNEAYRATGDRKYLEAGAHAVKHLIGWWQQPADHLVGGQVVGRNDWRLGTGYWTMHPRCDNCPNGFNGANPWMAGALLSALIQFYDYNADTQLVDRALLQTMLLQCMNYVVKYGWDAKQHYFIYAEGARGTNGGMNHLLFPLAYLGRLVQRGVPHRAWYDTADQWLAIARDAYDDWKMPKWRGSTSSGFYGYECVWPTDFWALMRALPPRGAGSHSADAVVQ